MHGMNDSVELARKTWEHGRLGIMESRIPYLAGDRSLVSEAMHRLVG